MIHLPRSNSLGNIVEEDAKQLKKTGSEKIRHEDFRFPWQYLRAVGNIMVKTSLHLADPKIV